VRAINKIAGIGPWQALPKYLYQLREGISLRLPLFADHSSAIQMQGHHMSVTRQSAAIQDISSDLKHLTDPGPFIHCALFLVVASVSSFIGAALLLTAI
jgi:hypothetical protein